MKRGNHWGVPFATAALFNIMLFFVMALMSLGVEPPQRFSLLPVSLYVLPPAPEEVEKPVAAQKPKPPEPVEEKVLGLAKPTPPPKPKVTPTPVPAKLAPVIEEVASPPAPLLPVTPTFVPLARLSKLPGFVHQVRPTYPASERFKGREATVLADVRLRADGSLFSIEIVESGGAAFDEAVVEAMKNSIFTPGFIDGAATPVLLRIPFTFKLR